MACMTEMERQKTMTPYKIIIDTDAGDDVDDILCVALALQSPEVEVLGITTVYKNTAARARMVRYLLKHTGFDHIPVFAGIGTPLLPRSPVDLQAIPSGYIPAMDALDIRQDMGAVEFIIETVRKYPGEVTLVAVGELTNLAVAFRQAPDIVPKIRRIYMMSGAFFCHMVEWNVLCDAQASVEVYRAAVEKYAVGSDVTIQCALTPEETERILRHGSPWTDVLAHYIRAFKASWPQKDVIPHDPLALASVFAPDFLRFVPAKIEICLEKGIFFGFTLNRSRYDYYRPVDKTPNCQCACEVDRKGFVDFLMERLCR